MYVELTLRVELLLKLHFDFYPHVKIRYVKFIGTSLPHIMNFGINFKGQICTFCSNGTFLKYEKDSGFQKLIFLEKSREITYG